MLLVFLHGKGADKDAYSEQLRKLAGNLSADIVSFNAPLAHPTKKDKFVWFNKIENNNRQEAIEEEYRHSVNFIEEKLQKLNYPLSDIVLIGHSQGGGIAVSVALELNLKCAISICGDLPYNLKYVNKAETPIYWLEGECDSYINRERKDSYKILKALGVNLNYRLVPNCTHSEIDPAFLQIKNILNKINT